MADHSGFSVTRKVFCFISVFIMSLFSCLVSFFVHSSKLFLLSQGLFLSTLVFVFLMPEFKVRNASLLIKPLLVSFPKGRIGHSLIKRRLHFVRIHRYLINQLTSSVYVDNCDKSRPKFIQSIQ